MGRLSMAAGIPCTGEDTPFHGVFSECFHTLARVVYCLGPELHRDLEIRRWFASEGLDVEGGSLSAPKRVTLRCLRLPVRCSLVRLDTRLGFTAYRNRFLVAIHF